MLNDPRPGEVWWADLGLDAKTRPVVIVSVRVNGSPLTIDGIKLAWAPATSDPEVVGIERAWRRRRRNPALESPGASSAVLEKEIIVYVVPLTTQQKSRPHDVPLPRLSSVANVQGLIAIRAGRLQRKFDKFEVLREAEFSRVKEAVLAFARDSRARGL